MTRAHQTLSGVIALLLLLTQVGPAISVCVCDMPLPATCCSDAAPPPEQKSSCCSETTSADQAAFSNPGCQRELVAPSLISGMLPTIETLNDPAFGASSSLANVSTTMVSTSDVTSFDRSRGSPPHASPRRIFLLDAALLI